MYNPPADCGYDLSGALWRELQDAPRSAWPLEGRVRRPEKARAFAERVRKFSGKTVGISQVKRCFHKHFSFDQTLQRLSDVAFPIRPRPPFVSPVRFVRPHSKPVSRGRCRYFKRSSFRGFAPVGGQAAARPPPSGFRLHLTSIVHSD